jgi:lysozyme
MPLQVLPLRGPFYWQSITRPILELILIATRVIEREEGYRSRPYRCSNGYPTVGIGQKIGGKNDPLPNFNMPMPVARAWLESNIQEITPQIADILDGLNEARQAIVISMAYQLGVSGLMGFRKFITAIKEQNWGLAGDEMLDSKWAKYDSLARAERHRKVIISGSIEGVY